MVERLSEQDLLKELEPTIIEGYENHMWPATGRGQEPINPVGLLAGLADPEGKEPQDPLVYGPMLRESLDRHFQSLEEEKGVDGRAALAAAFLVNLLTEDNLPHYASANDRVAMHSEALTLWLNEWIAEEDSHGVVMRDYGLLTGIIGNTVPHSSYQEGRVSQLRSGMDITLDTLAQGFTYLTTQELATYEAHRNLGWLLDTSGKTMMRRISGQEFNHHEFYRKMVSALLDLEPDRTMVAIHDQFANFAMPGERGIPEFGPLSRKIAVAGIFDVSTVASLQARLIKRWKISERQCQTSEGQQAQAELLDPPVELVNKFNRVVRGLDVMRERAIKQANESGRLLPFILNHTIELKQRIVPKKKSELAETLA